VNDAADILKHFVAARWLLRFRNRAALERRQARGMKRFRRELLAKLPLYRALAQSPLASFPIADKEFVREHFAGLNVLGLSYDEARALAENGEERSGISIGMSSGTSGNRALFLVDAKERRKWAGVMLARALPKGGLLRRHRAALLLASTSRLYLTTRDSGRLTFRFFNLREGLDMHLAELETFDPTVLIAPAHVLGLIARRQLAGALRLRPERVYSAAEVLDPAEAQAIAAAWGGPAHQIYQCTEGFLGMTCRLGTIHLNEEYVLFEKDWVDAARRAFNPMITDFSRRTQAIVRYRMNDILIASEHPCRCGSPLQAIDRIEGRRDDLLLFAGNGDAHAIMFPDDVRATVLDAAPAARDFALVQSAPDRLSLSLAGAVPLEQHAAARLALAAAVRRLGGVVPSIETTEYFAPVDHAAKLRRVRRTFPWPNATN
jgi:putative adenylate-forming enzyme